jgi:hypothetical protein
MIAGGEGWLKRHISCLLVTQVLLGMVRATKEALKAF